MLSGFELLNPSLTEEYDLDFVFADIIRKCFYFHFFSSLLHII